MVRQKLNCFRFPRKFILDLLLVIVLGLGPIGIVSAEQPVTCPEGMSTLDCQALFNNWTNWVPDDGSAGCVGAGGGSTLIGNDNVQKAFNYFVSKGLTAAQSAGIVGNLMRESGVNPNSTSNGGATIGIAQWEGERDDALRSFADSQNKPWNDLGVQLDYLWSELPSQTSGSHLGELQAIMPSATTSTSAIDAVKTMTTPDKAAMAFEYTFERAGNPVMSERISNANQVFTTYGGGSSNIGAGSACTGGGDFAANFIEYKQCNYNGQTVPWANAPYGNSTVCDAGCGPSAMAMIITNLTGQKVTPDMTAKYGYEHGTAYGGGSQGSLWNLPQVVGSHWGLTSTELGSSITKINQVLQSGGLVLATGIGPNPFTSGGHFIVIRAITVDGKWLTGNSAGYDSSQPYDPQQVIVSMQNAWGLTK